MILIANMYNSFSGKCSCRVVQRVLPSEVELLYNMTSKSKNCYQVPYSAKFDRENCDRYLLTLEIYDKI